MRASACELYVVAACEACWLVMLAALSECREDGRAG